MTDPVISIQSVTRRFGRAAAVNDFSFSVPKGSIVGLLGTNGAGKTTLMRMLIGHLYADAGTIQVFGRSPRDLDEATLRRIAWVSDSMQLPYRMRVRDVLKVNQGFFPNWNSQLADSLLERFQLDPASRYSQLSFGQKRRIVLLQAICQTADLLILDEPCSGLDVLARRQFLDVLLSEAVDRGQTILLSSHLLSDVERVVDHIGLMSSGSLLIEGNLDELKARLTRIRLVEPIAREDLATHFAILDYRVVDGVTEALIDGGDDDTWKSFQEARAQQGHAERLNLEDMFVELTQRA